MVVVVVVVAMGALSALVAGATFADGRVIPSLTCLDISLDEAIRSLLAPIAVRWLW